jgi:poly-gamma-glutamate system protein
MNSFTRHKIYPNRLYGLALISILLLVWGLLATEAEPVAAYPEMCSAAQQMTATFPVIAEARGQAGYAVDPVVDPLASGFIGIEFSPVTTTLGELRAKQLSTSPDFAAMIVKWLASQKPDPGATVVIHGSGSFPALLTAAIIACETIGVEPLILTSAGASSFGANLNGFLYWDMERVLFEQGLIQHRTVFATAGGTGDNGSSFWPGGLEEVVEAGRRNGLEIRYPESLQQSIDTKLEFIDTRGPVAALINIGGNHAAQGHSSRPFPAGFFQAGAQPDSSGDGLLAVISKRGIPVAHLLQLRPLAVSAGISPELGNYRAGKSGLYYTKKTARTVTSLALVIILAGIFLVQNRTKNQ